MRSSAFLVGFLLLCGVAPAAPWPVPERERALQRAEAALDDYYFADKIATVRSFVEKHRSDLIAIDEQEAFAKHLTVLLQKASGDGHFIVWYSSQADSNRTAQPTAKEIAENAAFYRYVGEGHSVTARLKGKIGYIRFGGFADLSNARPFVDSAMRLVSNTGALIVDLRGNGGGDSDTVDYLTGFFFAKPLELYQVSTRKNGRMETSHESSAPIARARQYLDKSVYVLIDGETISGGEMFAYSMKNTHRATVIGMPTAGAANGLSFAPAYLTDHMRLSVPDTRVISPVTNTNWEGGVVPDVRLPGGAALLYAYKRALAQMPETGDLTGELKAALANPAQALHDSFPTI